MEVSQQNACACQSHAGWRQDFAENAAQYIIRRVPSELTQSTVIRVRQYIQHTLQMAQDDMAGDKGRT